MLQLHEGTRVESADGEHVGDIDRLVVDPSGQRVSHVVIRKGVFFRVDRVIPVDVIEQADESVARLRPNVDAEELPPFEEEHYVSLDPATASELGYPEGPSLAWAHPMSPGAEYPMYPTYPYSARVEIEQNVPDDSAVIERGSHVLTLDGEDVGSIREVAIDERGNLSHVTVDPGWFKDETVIPAHWIRKVDEGSIMIGLGAETLRTR